jgi:hypothetical protein
MTFPNSALWRRVGVRVAPTGQAIEESVGLAHEVFNGVLRRAPERIEQKPWRHIIDE